jgi:hypothetical protein
LDWFEEVLFEDLDGFHLLSAWLQVGSGEVLVELHDADFWILVFECLTQDFTEALQPILILYKFVAPCSLFLYHILINYGFLRALLIWDFVLAQEVVHHGVLATAGGSEHEQGLGCLVLDEFDKCVLLALVIGSFLILNWCTVYSAYSEMHL